MLHARVRRITLLGTFVLMVMLLSLFPRAALDAAAEGSEPRCDDVRCSDTLSAAGFEPLAEVSGPWWNEKWDFRVPITVNPSGVARSDKPVSLPIDFGALLDDLGVEGALEVDSLRLLEVDDTGIVLKESVPFQFDTAGGDDGLLTFLLRGATPANEIRYFHLYFDLQGEENFAPQPVEEKVSVQDNVQDVGQTGFATVKVTTNNATYYYHKNGGGFANLVDKNGKDWISYNKTAGNAGDFRGIPNLVPPDAGGYFHPGRDGVVTQILTEGPLKATLLSRTNDNEWRLQWDIFPDYAMLTVQKTAAETGFWFLYEGTPGGSLETDSDFVVRSDGTVTKLSESWESALADEEWLFFGEGAANEKRSLYLVHHQADAVLDSYRPSNDKLMTIFGFGRKFGSLNGYMQGANHQFTIGLVEDESEANLRKVIQAAYKDLVVELGEVERRSYSLTVNVTGEGEVSIAPDQAAYAFGDMVTLTATTTVPAWVFSEWQGDYTGQDSEVIVTIEGDTEITAVFEQLTYELAIEIVGDGWVDITPSKETYSYGEVITLEAIPDKGWLFEKWEGDATGSGPVTTVIMEGPRAVSAHFYRPLYYIPLVAGD